MNADKQSDRLIGLLELLRAAESRHSAAAISTVSLLPQNNPATRWIQRLVTTDHNRVDWDCARKLLSLTAPSLRQRSVIARPFEIFWQNPVEPRHSALLAYFCDLNGSHGHREFVLREFFEVFSLHDMSERPLRPDKCRIRCEEAHIDILITRDDWDQKYAIIIENKVNGAADQQNQLVTYFEYVRSLGYAENSIHVIYLPLLKREPSADSMGDIDCRCARPGVIRASYETEVMAWLKSCTNATVLTEATRDHLKHYMNLVSYLIATQKGAEMMRKEIIELFTEGQDNPLPSWSDVQMLRTYITELTGAYRDAIGILVLEEIQAICGNKLSTCPACLCINHEKRIPGDAVFKRKHLWTNLSYRLANIVEIGAGFDNTEMGDNDRFKMWIGYAKVPGTPIDEQTQFQSLVLEQDAEIKERWKETDWEGYWFRWVEMDRCDNYLSHARLLAEEFLEMYRRITPIVAKYNNACPRKAPAS